MTSRSKLSIMQRAVQLLGAALPPIHHQKDHAMPKQESNTAALTRTLKQKAYLVAGPGFTGIVYGATAAGAIKAARDSLPKQSETWSAELADSETMYNAAVSGVRVINPPERLVLVENPQEEEEADDGQGGFEI